MQPTAGGIFMLLLCLSAPPAEIDAQDRPPSPAEQFQTLLKEYRVTSTEFRKAGTDAERKAAVERMDGFPPRLVGLVERFPKDSTAVDALVEVVRAMNAVDSLTMTSWDMNTTSFPSGSKDDSASRATAILLRDHLRSDKLGPVCERMSYGIRKEFETFLRAVLQKNPHKEVQALACLALAQILNTRVQKLNLVTDRPEVAERYKGLFGKDHFEEVQRQGRAQIAKEVETLLDRAVAEYGDVEPPFGGTAGEEAKARLFEIRHLAVGKEAPDIEGEDQDGIRFKLSDYRGKVVLLDFWQEF